MGLYSTASGIGADSDSSINVPSVGSLTFWVRPHDITGSQRFLGIANNCEIRMSNATMINDYSQDDTGSSLGTFSVGQLAHCVAVWSVSGGIARSYRDGALYNTNDDPESVTSGVMWMFTRAGDPFTGKLYDVRFYNRVLSPAEVLTIYNSRGADSIVHGMIHRWTMDEGADGATLTGSGTVKDRGANKINFSAATGPPQYVYDAILVSRRR